MRISIRFELFGQVFSVYAHPVEPDEDQDDESLPGALHATTEIGFAPNAWPPEIYERRRE